MNFSRRKIIKSLGMVAGATATGLIPGMSLFAQEKNNGKATNFFDLQQGKKALLIGTGKRGWRFGKFSEKHPEQLSIVAIGEPIADRRMQAANSLGLPSGVCMNNWEEVLEQKPVAEIAIIAASGSYKQACTAALLAGYDVWVDRPVSMNPDEVVAINKLARENNRQLLFCYIHEGKLNYMDHHYFEKNAAEA